MKRHNWYPWRAWFHLQLPILWLRREQAKDSKPYLVLSSEWKTPPYLTSPALQWILPAVQPPRGHQVLSSPLLSFGDQGRRDATFSCSKGGSEGWERTAWGNSWNSTVLNNCILSGCLRSVSMLCPLCYYQAPGWLHSRHLQGGWEPPFPKPLGTFLQLFHRKSHGSQRPTVMFWSPLETQNPIAMATFFSKPCKYEDPASRIPVTETTQVVFFLRVRYTRSFPSRTEDETSAFWEEAAGGKRRWHWAHGDGSNSRGHPDGSGSTSTWADHSPCHHEEIMKRQRLHRDGSLCPRNKTTDVHVLYLVQTAACLWDAYS